MITPLYFSKCHNKAKQIWFGYLWPVSVVVMLNQLHVSLSAPVTSYRPSYGWTSAASDRPGHSRSPEHMHRFKRAPQETKKTLFLMRSTKIIRSNQIITILQMEHRFSAPFSPQDVQKSASMKPTCPVMAWVSTDRAVGSLPCRKRTGEEASICGMWFNLSSWGYVSIILFHFHYLLH